MNVKLIVAAHKPYRMPNDPMYLPLHVGHAGNNDLGWQGDDFGDNISFKNPHYCELTGLYWAWKNLDADAIGLTHYRRHFTKLSPGINQQLRNFCGLGQPIDNWEHILKQTQVELLLSKTQVITPPKRNFFIETVANQYAQAHHHEDLVQLRTTISERSPEYLAAFDKLMHGTSVHLFNMFIMHRSYLEAYCTWLFDILFEVEKRINISTYTPYDGRVFGFLGERLFDVWLNTNKISYQECPVMFMEQQNWIKKGSSFLMRKMRNNYNN